MPFPQHISIKPVQPSKREPASAPDQVSSGITFDPSLLQSQPGNQIIWRNEDQQLPHWPGLCDANGNILNPLYFMPNQIAPGSPSTTFTPGGNITLLYACSLHPNEKGTIGKIQVGTGSTGQ